MSEKKVIDTIQISKKGYMYKLIQRVKKACSPDKTRYFMNFMYWDAREKTLVATDGRRLHMLTGSNIESLFKGVTSDRFVELTGEVLLCYDQKAYGRFPNWKRVIPDVKNLVQVDKDSGSNGAKQFDPFDASRLCQIDLYGMLLPFCTGHAINFQYLRELHGGEYRVMYSKDEGRALRFIDNGGRDYTFEAVIMPLARE